MQFVRFEVLRNRETWILYRRCTTICFYCIQGRKLYHSISSLVMIQLYWETSDSNTASHQRWTREHILTPQDLMHLRNSISMYLVWYRYNVDLVCQSVFSCWWQLVSILCSNCLDNNEFYICILPPQTLSVLQNALTGIILTGDIFGSKQLKKCEGQTDL